MPFRPSIPNIVEPVTDDRGFASKIWYDFFLNMFLQTGGDIILDKPSQSVYVDRNGSDTSGDGTVARPFRTIKKGVERAAIIKDPTVIIGAVVSVSPGTFIEDNPIDVPGGIEIGAWEADVGPVIVPANSASNLFNITASGGQNNFSGLIIEGAGMTGDAINSTGIGHVISYSDGAISNVLGNAISITLFSVITTRTVSFIGAIGTGVKVTSGSTAFITLTDSLFTTSVSGSIIDADASTVEMGLASLRPSSAARILKIDGGSTVNASQLSIGNATTGIEIGGSSSLLAVGIATTGNTTDLKVNDLTSTVNIIGGGLNKNALTFPAGYDNFNMLFVDNTEGERSTKIFGDLFVGRPELGTVMCTGQGEPVTRGLVVITTDSTATSTTEGGNLTDVSTEAQSFSGSTFSFQGTAADHTILIGLDLENGTDKLTHHGLQIIQTTAAVEVTPKSFVFEYWDGAAWTEFNVLSISFVESYRYANEVFIRANTNEMIRFDNTIQSGWTKKTISGDNLFWSRIRIDTAVTTAPVFQQFRAQRSFGEFAQDGITRFYGESRYKVTLLSAGNLYSETGGVANFNLTVGTGTNPTQSWSHRGNNQQMNGAGDAIYLQFTIPRGICTSCPLQIIISYIPEQAGASTDASIIISALPVEIQGVNEADPTGGTVPVARTLANTETITANNAQFTTVSTPIVDNTKIQTIESDPIDISNYYEGDMVFIRIETDSMGSANKDIFILSVELNAVLWSPGERLDS